MNTALSPKLQFTIYGKPIPKKRPRFARSGQVYDEQNIEKKQWCRQLPYVEIIKDPVMLDVVFHLTKTRTSQLSVPSGRPDLDNYLKWVMDCCNGRIWKDDAQVVGIYASKVFGEMARTHVEIQVLEQPGRKTKTPEK